MRALSSILLLGAVALAAPLSVVTTTTDLSEIVRAVGGEEVSVRSLCKGPEDPHFLEARPSFLRLVHDADLLVENGLEMEAAYLPLLVRNAANPRVRPGGPGRLDASAGVKRLGAREASRAEGDIHPGGNPHYLLDPANAAIVASAVAERLALLRPAAAAGFRERERRFRDEIEALLADWKGRFAGHRGARVVSYHDDVAYLAARLELAVVGTLEPKPGVPPTASHRKSLSELARSRGVKAVLHRVFQPKGPVEALCAEAGAKPVLLAHQPGATSEATGLLAMYRANAAALLRALEP